MSRVIVRDGQDWVDKITALESQLAVTRGEKEKAERYARELEASLSAVRVEFDRHKERTRSIVSEPGNAWDVIVKDRDEWKRRALKAKEYAECAFTKLEEERDEWMRRALAAENSPPRLEPEWIAGLRSRLRSHTCVAGIAVCVLTAGELEVLLNTVAGESGSR